METEKKQPAKVMSWALILSITIVLNLFINYAITLIYEQPEYPDRDIAPKVIVEGEVTEETEARRIVDEAKWEAEYEAYQDARDDYEKSVFVILIIAGIAIFLVSLIFKNNYVLSTSFGLAALLDFIIASIRYWSSAENLLRVSILLLALIVLIVVAYKKFGDK